MSTTTKYNGWSNFETWNVSLWIGNDEGLYNMAKRYRHRDRNPYHAFVNDLKEICDAGADLFYQTPDGVSWTDPALDIDALNQMIGEL